LLAVIFRRVGIRAQQSRAAAWRHALQTARLVLTAVRATNLSAFLPARGGDCHLSTLALLVSRSLRHADSPSLASMVALRRHAKSRPATSTQALGATSRRTIHSSMPLPAAG
jgi:hypothetical protein